jgi:hypothetical protein
MSPEGNRKNDLDQTCSIINAMISQEKQAYRIPDYLENLPGKSAIGHPVDAEARLLIAKWCIQLASVSQYSKETAAIAMSCLDRLVATSTGYDILLSRSTFQKAALTCLYTAVKVHEERALTPDTISKLSRGKHSKEQIEQMERISLKAIDWRVNPPTAMSFIRNYLELLPGLGLSLRRVIMELTECQIEYSILDYDFCRIRPSYIAFASLLNALDTVCGDTTLSSMFQNMVSHTFNIDIRSLVKLRNELLLTIPEDRLAELSKQQTRRYSSCGTTNSKWSTRDIYAESPRGVEDETI